MSRIAVFVDHDIITRHFILSGALKSLESAHDLVYIFPEYPRRVSMDLKSLPIGRYRTIPVSDTRASLYKKLYHSAVLRQLRGTTEQDVMYTFWKGNLGPKPFWKAWFFSWPLTYVWRRNQIFSQIGPYPELDKVLQEERPDLILHPTVLEGLFVSDLVRWGQDHHVPTLFLMNSWDNPATKAMTLGTPSRLAVWGEHSKKLAISRMGVPAENIAILGAAQFDGYRLPPRTDASSFRQSLSIQPGQKVVLYAGSSMGLDETTHLELLDRAIEQKELPACTILYRPHPWRPYPAYERDFFHVTFKHVVMDPAMVAAYKNGRHSERVVVEQADYADTHVTLSSVDAVISPLSTILLEAALHGKPIAAYLPDQEKERCRVAYAVSATIHYREFFERFDCLTCRKPEELITETRNLLKKTEDPTLAERLKVDSRYFVESSPVPYSERLLSLVESMLPVTSPARVAQEALV